MYKMPYYKEPDHEKVMDFMRQHPFAFVMGIGKNNQPVATQLPLFIDVIEDKIILSGHLMRKTDHHVTFAENSGVLAVFTGPQCYVSASWYKDPQSASTWNYMSVHAHGVLKFMDDEALVNILKRTTDHFENNPASPANFNQLPVDYVQQLSKAIVAFEIEVTSLDHVFKLSQNKDKENYTNIISQLEKGDENARMVAVEMKKRIDHLFPST
jgi:transcriptional regulator